MPSEMDEALFKQAMGGWASGVAVVTTQLAGRVHGMTVTAFSSVSLQPPLVLVSASSRSNTNGLIRESGLFAVNILAAGQREVSDRFAGRDSNIPPGERFTGV